MLANDGNGIVERDLAAIDQYHRRHAGDGLADRMNRKDGVRRHWRAGLDVALAEVLQIDRLAVALDQDDGARNPPRRDFAIEETLDRRQFRNRELGPRRRPEIGGP
jgi:hypothetical protein